MNTVLSCIAVIRNYNIDRLGGRSPQSGNCQKQFHDIIIDRGTSRLTI